MRLVLGDDATVAAWAAARLGIRSIQPPFVAFGVVDDERILQGAIVFNEFNGFSIEATVVGVACAQRRFIRAVLDYAFRQNEVLNLRCRTRVSNTHICNQLERLGFLPEGTLVNYFGPTKADHAAMYRLPRKKAARWLQESST